MLPQTPKGSHMNITRHATPNPSPPQGLMSVFVTGKHALPEAVPLSAGHQPCRLTSMDMELLIFPPYLREVII